MNLLTCVVRKKDLLTIIQTLSQFAFWISPPPLLSIKSRMRSLHDLVYAALWACVKTERSRDGIVILYEHMTMLENCWVERRGMLYRMSVQTNSYIKVCHRNDLEGFTFCVACVRIRVWTRVLIKHIRVKCCSELVWGRQLKWHRIMNEWMNEWRREVGICLFVIKS